MRYVFSLFLVRSSGLTEPMHNSDLLPRNIFRKEVGLREEEEVGLKKYSNASKFIKMACQMYEKLINMQIDCKSKALQALLSIISFTDAGFIIIIGNFYSLIEVF